MKTTTLSKIEGAHRWGELSVFGGDGNAISSRCTCRDCGIVRRWHDDEQHGIHNEYSFFDQTGDRVSVSAAMRCREECLP